MSDEIADEVGQIDRALERPVEADAGVPQLRKMPRDQAADDRPAEQLLGARNRQALRQQLGAGRLPPLADLVPVLHCLSPIVFSRARAAWAPSRRSWPRP